MTRNLKTDLRKKANKKKAKQLQRFFKTGKGEYGEGDLFLGITVPEIRKTAKKYTNSDLTELKELIASKYHEERMAALLILVDKQDKKTAYDFYIKNRRHINNWDLIDLTAPKIVGIYLEGKDKDILYKFAKSKNIWERRIAMLSCFHYIYKGDHKDALKIAEILKDDKEDLIQKAVGWMLREVGKRCHQAIEEEFLKKHSKTMPRTMLRYAIERFPEKKRKMYLEMK
ncbi:MAG: DNA alkylation repair protein [Candidatus Pacebacteria bacterium]|nr:DNA alkylation repair protein [Candidatus Paceibacterota bacterium]